MKKKIGLKYILVLIITFTFLVFGSNIASVKAVEGDNDVVIDHLNSAVLEGVQDNNTTIFADLSDDTNSDTDTSSDVGSDIETKPTPPSDLGNAVSNDENGINDNNLYSYLLKAYNSYYGFSSSDSGYAKQIYNEMFSEMETLDLSISHGSIKSLEGLSRLNLENLKVLNVSNNQISEINVDDLKYLDSLQQLILFDNDLTSFPSLSALQNLQVLNLSNNNLASIDISSINVGKIYLSFNKFTSINDITLPRIKYDTDLFIELFNNNITDADELYLSTFDVNSQVKIELGLQGIGLNYKRRVAQSDREISIFSCTKKFKFYNSTNYPNMEIRIYDYITNDLVRTISNSADNKITEYNLPIGEYKAYYYENNSATNDMFNNDDPLKVAFKYFEYFKVIPSSPTIKFVVRNKEYDTYGKINGKASLKAYNTDDNGEIYYKVASGDWVKGDTVTLDYGGQYMVSFKCVVDGDGEDSFESEIETIFVQQSLNTYIPDIVMILIIGVLAAVIFAVVIPFVAKYINRK